MKYCISQSSIGGEGEGERRGEKRREKRRKGTRYFNMRFYVENRLLKNYRTEKTRIEHWVNPEPTAETTATFRPEETKRKRMSLIFTSLGEVPLWSWESATSECFLMAESNSQMAKDSGKSNLQSVSPGINIMVNSVLWDSIT